MTFSIKKLTMAIAAAGILGVAGLTTNNNNDNGTVQAATAGDVATVSWSGESIQVFSDADSNSQVVNYLPTASSWKIMATKTDNNGTNWYQVASNQWVMSSLMADGYSVAQAATNNTSDAQKVIDLAKEQIGKPYVWGAKGPNAFDCSGLMNYVFQQALGRNIGGWTVPQESAGTQVSVMSAQPGDLLFWGGHGSTYHVALYIGDGQYIHAPQPGDSVKIASVSTYFWPSFAVRPF